MSTQDIVIKCFDMARAELNKITAYSITLEFTGYYERYEYINGEFIREELGDRGEKYRYCMGHTEHEFVEGLIYNAVKRFAFSYECKHRRKFEDNRRQVNDIIECCYSYMSPIYKYTLMGRLKDNINIYFHLLDYYVEVSKGYLELYIAPESVKERIQYIAEKQYASCMGGMYDVALSFEMVRYNISRIVEVVPALAEIYYHHDVHYDRLKELEKVDPDNAKKYQLGAWNYNTIAKAEDVIKGNYNYDEAVLNCAVVIMINRVHTGRNLTEDVDKLIELLDIIGVEKYREPLEEFFVARKYIVFAKDEFEKCREKIMTLL